MDELLGALKAASKKVKCLVWDLDNTLWNGVLAEGDNVALFENIAMIVRALDERGVLQSIASKNDEGPAIERLERLGLAEYFLCPEIHWGPKSVSIERIAQRLNIGIDSMAFIDDQPFERDEVASMHASVLCLDSVRRHELLDMPEFTPRFITNESYNRRRMYVSDESRRLAENAFEGPREEFLATLGMVFTIAAADAVDVQRLEELIARTNQLNTTGRIYSFDEINAFRCSDRHDLWAASLHDVYGDYGKIGIALVEKDPAVWTIKAFLISCRVMSRGIGSVFIQWLLDEARRESVVLRADLIPNERNRMMVATYRFAGFRLLGKLGDREIYEHPLGGASSYPDYVTIRTV